MSDIRPKILIVEDDAAFGYAASRYLEKVGYETIVCLSSMMAFKELEGNKIDAVITDVRLLQGEPHGLALARMIRNRTPEMPVLLMTAYPELLDGEISLPGPLLRKPLALEALAEALKTSLADASGHHSQV